MMATATPPPRFYLVPEPLDGESARREPIAVPAEGVSYLALFGPPRLVDGGAGAVLLETIATPLVPVLIVIRQDATPVLINGARPLPLAVVRPGDFVRLPDGPALRIVRYDPPAVGPTPSGAVGTPCAICRMPMAVDAVVYVCPACGLAVHCEGPDRGPAGERLECALLGSACVRCGSPVRPEGGWDHGQDS